VRCPSSASEERLAGGSAYGSLGAVLAPEHVRFGVSCIVAARPGGRYAARVSQPEIQRQVRQQRGDIDALYELVQGVDQKVDALDVKLDRRFDELSGQLAEVLRQLGAQ